MCQDHSPIQPEDYLEPDCPLNCGQGRTVRSVPQGRIQEKLDEYMAKKDYPGAERHLLYWQEEARQGRDLQGQLLICNELIGYYRKTGCGEKAFAAGDEALGLLRLLSLEDGISAGTTYVNLATAYSTFGQDERALVLFSRARSIYEKLGAYPELLGGLYNNMGLTCAALGRYGEAYALYDLALKTMQTVSGSEPELAITYMNIADALDAEQGGTNMNSERIGLQLSQARRLLLDSDAARDGYFAYVCERCAPGFRYYGDADSADKLERIAEAIYEWA